MKTLDLKNYKVQEMNTVEMVNNEGGSLLQTVKDWVNHYILPSIIQWD